MILYHVTPSENNELIGRQGIDPTRSQGKRKVSWWVDIDRLGWAIAHCSARHHTAVDELSIWTMDESEVGSVKRTRLPGVYVNDARTVTCYLCPADVAIEVISNPFMNFCDLDPADDFAPPPDDVNDIPF